MSESTQEAGMLCFFIAVILIVMGYFVWKKNKTNLIPGYKKKEKENTAAYCAMAGKGIISSGIGFFILSVPISMDNPNKYFALCCLLCCLVFLGMGISLYLRAEKLFHSS